MSAILNVLSGTKNDIRDKKRYQGDISFLCPPIINLIKAQVCDKCVYTYSDESDGNHLGFEPYPETLNPEKKVENFVSGNI